MLNNILYKYSNMDNSSQILLFLIILVALMLISILVINLITKKRNEKYDRQFNPIDRYTKTIEKKSKTKENLIRKVNINETNKKVETITPVKKEEKIKPINEEIEVMDDPEVIEVVSGDSSIDKISMLIEDNIDNSKPIDLTEFEKEEEKNAIISYDELVKRAGAKKIIYKTEKATINEEIKQDKIEIKEENKSKFRASEVISPIYGVRKQQIKQKEELDEFIDLENIETPKRRYVDEDLQKDITFLTSLKTFRSNLD